MTVFCLRGALATPSVRGCRRNPGGTSRWLRLRAVGATALVPETDVHQLWEDFADVAVADVYVILNQLAFQLAEVYKAN